tara:strand:- start:22816 stop:24159 length:1344 start_codon:yes stop_codon:yes gene_type:complete
MKKNKLVSIIIRTKNEENWISICLDKIFKQNYKNFEVIIVDNNSTDKTVKRALEYKVKIVKIKKFYPGKAINLGIKKSKGDIIVCLSAHCIPVNDNWLKNLIQPLKNKQIAGSYGRQEPYSFSSDFDKRDLLNTFGLDKKIQKKDSFFHNANSAFTKKTWKKFPFDENITNIEDRIWGNVVIKAGYKIFYNPDASVFHYHGIHQDLDPVRCKQIVGILESFGGEFKSSQIKENKKNKILAIIPQRDKTKIYNKQNLISYTINEIKQSKKIKEIVVSTNDINTKKISESLGAKVPFLRPKNLSESYIDLNSVLKFTLEKLERNRNFFDIVVIASENYPLRKKNLFDKMISKLILGNYDTVIACKTEKGSVWQKNRFKTINLVDNSIPSKIKSKKTLIANTGYACVTRPNKIRGNDILNGKVYFYEIDDHNSFFEIQNFKSFKKFVDQK